MAITRMSANQLLQGCKPWGAFKLPMALLVLCVAGDGVEAAAPVEQVFPSSVAESSDNASLSSYPEQTSTNTTAANATTNNTTSGAVGNPLFLQLQSLQEEVRQLRGMAEEQAHAIEQLKEQQKQQYLDLDRRLGGSSAAATSSPVDEQNAVSEKSVKQENTPVSTTPGNEVEAYSAAYALMKQQKNEEAIEAFKAFLKKYPKGDYAPNAYYWLGIANMNINQLNEATNYLQKLLNQYPGHNKYAPAMYQLGVLYHLQGNTAKAKQLLQKVSKEFPDTSAGRAATKYLQDKLK